MKPIDWYFTLIKVMAGKFLEFLGLWINWCITFYRIVNKSYKERDGE